MEHNFEHFRAVVEHVFNSWTGLQLAVAHGMATNGRDGRQVALDCVDFIADYCLTTNNLSVENIEDELVDMMEDEFDTSLEDNSPREIAHIFDRFLNLLKIGNLEQFRVEFCNLPAGSTAWLSQAVAAQVEDPVASTSAEQIETTDMDDVPMEQEDSDWTTVRGKKNDRRKK